MTNVEKLFVAVFVAFLLMPVLVLAYPPINGTVQTLGAIRIKNQTFYSPYPVEPGKYFDFYIAVRNQDKNTVNVVCSFVESFPFSLDSNEQADRTLDSFAPDTELLLKYKIRVAETAVEGLNPVKFRCYDSSSPSVVYTVDLPVYVQPQDAVILVSSVSSSPETFSPGSAGTLKVVLKSEAKIELKDVRVKLDVSSSALPFAPASGTSTKKIASLPAGESAELVYGLLSSPDAVPGLYKTTLELSYYDRLGKQYSRNETVGLVVAAARLVYHPSKVLEDGVVQADRDLGLPGLRPNSRPAPSAREINVAIALSYGLFHRAPSGACSPSRQRSLEACRVLDTRTRRPAGSQRRSAPESQIETRGRRRGLPGSMRGHHSAP